MYGVTEGGSSVAAFVHGFEPYFYVEAPSPSFSPDDCQALAAELNVSGSLGMRSCWTGQGPVAACLSLQGSSLPPGRSGPCFYQLADGKLEKRWRPARRGCSLHDAGN